MDFSEWDGTPDHALHILLAEAFASAIVANRSAGIAALDEFGRRCPGDVYEHIHLHCNGLFGV